MVESAVDTLVVMSSLPLIDEEELLLCSLEDEASVCSSLDEAPSVFTSSVEDVNVSFVDEEVALDEPSSVLGASVEGLQAVKLPSKRAATNQSARTFFMETQPFVHNQTLTIIHSIS